MDREILFRGKQIDKNQWINGSFIDLDSDSGYAFILPKHENASTMGVIDLIKCTMERIYIKTLSQYTGLNDKNGVKIFKGDIIRVFDTDKKRQIQQVVFKDGMFCGYNDKKSCPHTSIDVLKRSHDVEVIGNIHDNPELMEG